MISSIEVFYGDSQSAFLGTDKLKILGLEIVSWQLLKIGLKAESIGMIYDFYY